MARVLSPGFQAIITKENFSTISDMEMENLMEKIRAKAVENPQRTLMDTSKIVRINMADRKHSLDTVDKGILRKVTYQDLVFWC